MSTKITAPDGWTTDADTMNIAYYWADNMRGNEAAQKRGLDNPTPLMRLDPDDGGDQFLFSSGGKFYLWNLVSDDVSVIVSPTSQGDVIKALGDMLTTSGSKELKVEFVPLKDGSE